MNNKYILLGLDSKEGVFGALQDFANLYNAQDFTNGIEVYSVADSEYLLQFKNIDDEHFRYAVNYLRYPESKANFSSVLGYCEEKSEMYYVPDTDDEYDCCYTVDSSGVCKKHSFSGESSIVESGQQYIEPNFDRMHQKQLATIVGVVPAKKGFFAWLFR